MDVSINDILFHVFAAVATIAALLVIFMSSPVYSSLFLALTMTVLGVLFFMLEAYFVAAAQIVVYAGAVMVLFVMILMLFDLKHDYEDFLKLTPLSLSKVLSVSILCGLLIGAAWLAIDTTYQPLQQLSETAITPTTSDLSKRLFTKFVFAFEAVSLLLLVAIVGVVGLARSKGGTHHGT